MTAITIIRPASIVVPAREEDPRFIVDLSEFKDARQTEEAEEAEDDCQQSDESSHRSSGAPSGPAHIELEEEEDPRSVEIEEGVPVREGAAVRFSPNPVSSVQTRPATAPEEKSERYYLPADFARFRREYRDQLRRKAEKRRAAASPAATGAKGDSSANAARFSSPLTALINAAAKSFVTLRAEGVASHRASSSAPSGREQDGQTSTLVDTLYLF